MTRFTVTLLLSADVIVLDGCDRTCLTDAALLARHFADAGRALYKVTIDHDGERWTWRTTHAQILQALALGAR